MPKSDYLSFGGQAIVEGVMMRSPNYYAIACRAPNGQIVVRTEPLEKTWIGRQRWLKLPFLRGTFAILDAMTLGTKAMNFASQVQLDPKFGGGEEGSTPPEGEGKAPEALPDLRSPQEKKKDEFWQKAQIVLAMVVGLGLGFLIFNAIPQFIAQLTGVQAGDKKGTLTNILAELIKIVIFLGYLWGISRLAAIREVFKYHGAEHKAINTWEHDRPLSMEECKLQTRLHPRCGTSFAVIVFLVGLLLLPFVPRYPITGQPGTWYLDALARIGLELFILVPMIAGISYELLRLAGKLRDQRWVNIAFWPGLASQKFLTTIEPEEKQVEVALASLQAVVHAEKTGELYHTDDAHKEPVPYHHEPNPQEG